MGLAWGSRIGPYEVLGRLGEGGMGEVYRARDTRLGREVAIKLLSAERVDPRSRGRFEREAQLASAVSHANVLALYDVGEHDGLPYLVNELLQGKTLREVIEAGPIPWRTATSLAQQVAEGLAAAHEKGIVHRDLKPENLFLTAGGQVKILDFGIARLIEVAERGRGSNGGGPMLTATGTALGTPSYMSPEQLRAERVDARSDLFSFGCVLYELLCGRRPFVASTGVEIAFAILHREPEPLPHSTPPQVARLILRCLQKAPVDRYQTARELSSALRALSGSDPAETPNTDHAAPMEEAAPPPPASGTRAAVAGLTRTLFGELKRRRVLRALVGYGAAAFAVLQVVEPIMHGLQWPDAVLGYVVVALGAGFPLSVALAWVFDVKAGRIQRTAPLVPLAPPALRGVRLGLILGGIGLLAAAPGIAWYFLRPGARVGGERVRAASAAVPSIAVLPFANDTGDPQQEYISDGITDEIIEKLSRLRGLSVAAHLSVNRFKNTKASPAEIGAALGVEYLLEGSVRRAGDRMRVTTTLLKAAQGFRIWSDSNDAGLSDILAVQQRIAVKTVDALALKLSPDDRDSLTNWGTRNPAAYDEYLKGKMALGDWSRRRLEQVVAARGHYEKALAIDPQFAPALAALAKLEAHHYRTRVSDPRGLERAEALAKQALEIDPRISDARLAIAHCRGNRYDYVGAVELYRALVADEPQNYQAWDELSWALAYQTPPKLAEAEEAARRALQLNPAYHDAYYHLARALALQGKLAEAERLMAIFEERYPRSELLSWGRFWLHLASKRPGEALAGLGDPSANALKLALAAMALAQLGRIDEAFARLEQAISRGYRDPAELRGSAWFEPLRRDPRFDALLARHGLAR